MKYIVCRYTCQEKTQKNLKFCENFALIFIALEKTGCYNYQRENEEVFSFCQKIFCYTEVIKREDHL